MQAKRSIPFNKGKDHSINNVRESGYMEDTALQQKKFYMD